MIAFLKNSHFVELGNLSNVFLTGLRANVKVPLFLRKLVLGISAQASGKNYAAANASGGAPVVLLHSLDTQQGASNIILAMTRRDVGKPAFSLRKKRFVKTHALSLLRTKNLRYAVLRFQDFQRGNTQLLFLG